MYFLFFFAKQQQQIHTHINCVQKYEFFMYFMMSAVYETNKKFCIHFFWEGNGLKTNPPRKKQTLKQRRQRRTMSSV